MNARNNHFAEDSSGRTVLFDKAECGDLAAVTKIIYSLSGTGIYPQRLALISHEDRQGLTAIDVARSAGHKEVADVLHREMIRMEWNE